MDPIYGFSANIIGASRGAYVSIAFTSGKSISSTFSATPSRAEYTFFSDEGVSLTWQGAGGDSGAGAGVSAQNAISGSIIISPPIDVPLEIVVRGAGKILGTHTTPPGTEQDTFNIVVSAADALSEDQAMGWVKGLAAPSK